MSYDQPQRAGIKYSPLYLARRKFRQTLIYIGLWAMLIGATLMVVAVGNPDEPLSEIFYGAGLRLSASSVFFFGLRGIRLTDRTNPRWTDFIQNKVSLFIMGIGWLLMNSVALSSFGWWDLPTWWERLALSCLLLGFLLAAVDVDFERSEPH